MPTLLAQNKWGMLDENKLEKDYFEFKKRLSAVLTKHNLHLLQLAGKLHAKKIKHANPEEIQLLEDQLEAQKKLLTELKTFISQIQFAVDHFLQQLKAIYLTQSENDVQSKEYEASYHAVVDCLVHINAFKKNKYLEVSNGVVTLWSKIHQRYAEILAKKRGGVTLESSFAGYLFDGLSWGTKWSTDPSAPLKQFWMRMSKEIAHTAVGNRVELHVLEQVVVNSAFYTDEWPKIEASIRENKIEALHLYPHTFEENQNWIGLNAPKEPIIIKTQEELEKYIKTPDQNYQNMQQKWQDTQRVRGKWEKSLQAMVKWNQRGELKKSLEDFREIKEWIVVEEKMEEKKSFKDKMKDFFSRHKRKILLGALAMGLIAGGLFTLGILSAVGLIAGGSMIGMIAAGAASTAVAIGAGVVAHAGVTGAAVGVAHVGMAAVGAKAAIASAVGIKAIVGSSVVTLGASAAGGTTGMVSGILADKLEGAKKPAKSSEEIANEVIVPEEQAQPTISASLPLLPEDESIMTEEIQFRRRM